MNNNLSLGAWPGIPESKINDELMKRSMLYKVANEAASRGKELASANTFAEENSSTFEKFKDLRGGKKIKTKKNKTNRNKTKRNKTKRNKTKRNKTKKNKKRR